MTQGLGELERFISDLGSAPGKVHTGIRRILGRGGLEMKKKMQADFSRSRSFRHIARSVTYTTNNNLNPSVEVGPDRASSSSAPLAGIAYFGGSRGGGGTVKEPDYILDAEADTAADHIAKLFGDAL